MHQVGAVASRALRNEQPMPGKSSSGARPPSDTNMVKLWERMAHLYGHKWTSTYGESAAKGDALTDAAQTWAAGLVGVNGAMIAAGLRQCAESGEAWPPSLPEFKGLCKPSNDDLGLPSADEAYRAAAQADWSLHPIVWHTAKMVGSYELRNGAEAVTRPRFMRAYAEMVNRVMAGEQFEQKEQNVPRIERQYISREEGKARFGALLNSMKGGAQA